MVSDFIAEIILKRVDILLSDWIQREKISEKIILTRYRDDYRILSRTEEDSKKILKELGRILNTEYNLSLNEEKTNIFNDILEGTIRDWSSEISDDFLLRQVKYEEMGIKITFSYLKDILLKIYKIQKKYPNGRPSVTLLSKLITHLDKKDVIFEIDESDTHTLVSILRKLSLAREEASAQVFMLLDIFFKKLSKPAKKDLINQILKIIEGANDYDYQVIWLYRLCLAHQPSTLGNFTINSSPLLEILGKEYTKRGGKSDLDIFPKINNLDSDDQKELKKFSLVSHTILAGALNKEISKEAMKLFSYKGK